jgi:hypothetical protein
MNQGLVGREEGYFHIERRVKDWVRIAEDGHTPDLPPYDFVIDYNDLADTGAVDRYIIRVIGSPLTRVPDEMGSWAVKIGPFPEGMETTMARTREYFISKLEGKTLDR